VLRLLLLTKNPSKSNLFDFINVYYLRKELRSWDPIVHENRAAEQLFFPLNDANTFFGVTIDEKAKSFTVRI
jgi:hypothetical protein